MSVTNTLSSGQSRGKPQLRTLWAMPSWRQNSIVRTLTSSILAGPSLFSFFSTSKAVTPRRPRSAARASPIGPPPTISTGVRTVAPIVSGSGCRGHVHRHPAGRRLLAWVNGAAVLAGAGLLIAVERSEQRRQVLDDILDLHFDAMHALAAVEAIPFEAVDIALAPRPFDHEADRARNRPLRRVADVRPDEKHLTLSDRDVVDLAILGDLQSHVALELIEELLDR